jgi:hypothetical protein
MVFSPNSSIIFGTKNMTELEREIVMTGEPCLKQVCKYVC